jgi:hypothetical protein
MYVGGGTFSLLRGHIKGFSKVMKVLKSGSPNVATLASSPILTWSFFRLSKGYER